MKCTPVMARGTIIHSTGCKPDLPGLECYAAVNYQPPTKNWFWKSTHACSSMLSFVLVHISLNARTYRVFKKNKRWFAGNILTFWVSRIDILHTFRYPYLCRLQNSLRSIPRWFLWQDTGWSNWTGISFDLITPARRHPMNWYRSPF